MGSCCSNDDDDDQEFTSLDMWGNVQQGSPNSRRNKKSSKTAASSSTSKSEEVHFEYDEKTQRLIPIIKNRHRSRRHRDGGGDGKSGGGGGGASSRGRASSRGQMSDNRSQLSDAMSDGSYHRAHPDIGRDDNSLVDCMSEMNQSFDVPYDDNTMMRMTNFERADSNATSGSLGTTPQQQSGKPTPRGNSAENNNGGDKNAAVGDGGGVLSPQQENNNNNNQDDEFTVDDMIELEEISRSEIFAACMVAYQMLRFAVKRITPTVHFMLPDASTTTRKHVDPNNNSNQQDNQSNRSNGNNNNKNDDNSDDLVSPQMDTFLSTSTVIQMMNRKKPGLAESPSFTSGADGGSAQQTPSAAADSHSLLADEDQGDMSVANASIILPSDSPQYGPTTKRVQLLLLDARNIKTDGSKVKSIWLEGKWDFFNSGQAEVSAQQLSEGKALFAFKCFTHENAVPDDHRVLAPFINLSSYPDEVKDNNVPYIDLNDKKQMKKFTIILTKAMYLLPGLEKDDIDAALWASRTYCEACVPNVSKFEDPLPHEKNTFRMHKPLIRFIFSLVIQFQISEITDPKVLRDLAAVDGFVPVKALLYERTKRDKSKTDMTAKAKSLLLFQQVPGGMLVSNVVGVFNTSLPGVIASLVNNFGSSGAEETEQVASKTRKFVTEKIVKPRLEKQQQKK